MVAKFLDLKNLSWGRRSFALSNDRGKVWATVLFLSAIMHRKFIHVKFFVFFCYISRTGTVCWDPEMLLPWQRYVTTSPLYWQCLEDILGGGVSSVVCTYGLATKRYWTQRFNDKFLVLIGFPVISRWHMWDGGVQSWCLGTVPEHGSVGAVTWLRSLFIYPR